MESAQREACELRSRHVVVLDVQDPVPLPGAAVERLEVRDDQGMHPRGSQLPDPGADSPSYGGKGELLHDGPLHERWHPDAQDREPVVHTAQTRGTGEAAGVVVPETRQYGRRRVDIQHRRVASELLRHVVLEQGCSVPP